MTPRDAPLSWLGIVRLGLVQTALGAIVVLSISTVNRIMQVELALSALLPGSLVGLHYALQVLRPRLGWGSDVGGRRTPWILGGMTALAAGGFLAALATSLMRAHLLLGIALAIPAYVLIGLGAGAAGTTLLVLIAKGTAPERRPAAATIAWVMMIVGFILTAATAGKLLDPYSPSRLVEVAAAISSCGLVVTALAVWGVERGDEAATAEARRAPGSFGAALRDVWAEAEARRFTIFIFVSMLAYGSEEFLIEPFAGIAFGMGPGETAKLSGLVHAGTLVGLVLVGLGASLLHRHGVGALKGLMAAGCLGSSCALAAVAALGIAAAPAMLRPALLGLGVANGLYASAAISGMMQLVGPAREGVRMGLWGAAQAVALGGGGLVATASTDFARRLLVSPTDAVATVFAVEAAIFIAAAILAIRLAAPDVGTDPRAAAERG